MRLGAIGCGNVGFNTLKAFHLKSHGVIGLDPDPAVKHKLRNAFGSRAVANQISDLAEADAIFICVPTDPVPKSQSADLSIFRVVIESLVELEHSSDWRGALVVQRSTCPPGTAKFMSSLLSRSSYAVNPSFLSKSTAWQDSKQPPRIAFAGPPDAILTLTALYADFPGAPTFASHSYEQVELLKYVENTIDSVLISLWNEYLALADSLKLSREDFIQLLEALPDRPRFASAVRVPGGAFSRWCFPKDLAALVAQCSDNGVVHNVLRGAAETNDFLAHNVGINEAATAELITTENGRVCVTEAGRNLLLSAAVAPPHLHKRL